MNVLSTDPHIGIAGSEDFDDIQALLLTEYAPPWSERPFWDWRYLKNPVFDVYPFVGLDDDGRVIAMQVVSKVRCERGVSSEDAYFLTAAITHPDHRRKGWFRNLIVSIEQWIADYTPQATTLYTFPNVQSRGAFLRFDGWSDLDDLQLLLRPVSPVSSVLRRILPDWSGMHEVDSHLASGFSIRECVTIDELPTEPVTVPGLTDLNHLPRSGAYLNWRYADNPTADYAYLLAEQHGKPLGYTVLRREQRSGLAIVYIAELQANSHDTASALLSHSLKLAHAERADLLAVLSCSNDPFKPLYARWGLSRRLGRMTGREFHVMGKTIAPADGQLPDARPNWYFSFGDLDVV